MKEDIYDDNKDEQSQIHNNMGRNTHSKQDLNQGAWTVEEDCELAEYVKNYSEAGWRTLPKKAGLNQCGKSCRLQWLNYLRSDIEQGNITRDEKELIIWMHHLLGNRWALIAGGLPGRTDNEKKKYWYTHLSKKLATSSSSNSNFKKSILLNAISSYLLGSLVDASTRINKAKYALPYKNIEEQECSIIAVGDLWMLYNGCGLPNWYGVIVKRYGGRFCKPNKNGKMILSK